MYRLIVSILIISTVGFIMTGCLPTYYTQKAEISLQKARTSFVGQKEQVSRDQLNNLVNSLNKLDIEEQKLREEIKKYIENNIEQYSYIKSLSEGAVEEVE